MNGLTKTEVNQKVQVKFSQFFEKLSFNLSLPEKKFIKDISRGIISSKSCTLRKISQSLKEEIDLKKSCKRLSYHLNKKDLNNHLTESHISNACKSFKKDTLIICDPSDIFKQYSKKMQGLSYVKDGSKDKLVSGYDTLNIIAADKCENNLSLKPISSELFSNTLEIDSLKNILFDRLVSIIISSKNKGIFIFDRGYDDKKIYSFFKENNSSFIIRSKTVRNLYYKGKREKFLEVAKRVNLSNVFITKKKQRNGKRKDKRVFAGIIDVEIPVDPYQRKNPRLIPAKLFVGRYEKGGYWYILCSLPNHQGLSDAKLTEFIFNAYKIRWKIE